MNTDTVHAIGGWLFFLGVMGWALYTVSSSG